jgi:DNA-directed RNA polymerase subunit RPC12/RpoP
MQSAAPYVIIAFCFGLAGGIVGRLKGSSFWLWFAISGLVPFFGLLAAVAYRFERDELRRRCPRCGRIAKVHDAVCMRCGEEFDYPDTVVAPESWVRTPAPPGSRAGSTG